MHPALSVFVQLYVPVQVVPPAQRRVPDPDGKRDHRHPPRLERRSDQSHARFTRGPAAFLVIARQTGGNDVLPRGITALNDRRHMIEGKFLGRIFTSAVLAGILVPQIDIGPREPDFLISAFDLDEFEQAQDGGKFERNSDATDFPVVEVDHLDFALREQGDRPLPGNDL